MATEAESILQRKKHSENVSGGGDIADLVPDNAQRDIKSDKGQATSNKMAVGSKKSPQLKSPTFSQPGNSLVPVTSPLDMAISNLTCPSPPPILNNGPHHIRNVSPHVSPPPSSIHPPQPGRETIRAGGAILQELERGKQQQIYKVNHADNVTRNDGTGSNVDAPLGSNTNISVNASAHTSNSNLTSIIKAQSPGTNDDSVRNDSVTSLDYTANPPHTSAHHKAPSVHAHFYVDEAVKLSKNITRSRSGSNSGSDSAALHGLSIVTSPTLSAGSGSVYEKQPSSASTSMASIQRFNNSSTSISGSNNAIATPSSALGRNEQNANIDPRLPTDDGKFHILLGVCGALSTVKIKLIIAKLFEIYTPQKLSIQLILTKSSDNFISPEAITHLETVRKIRIWRDADEWTTWKTRSDPVLHIELRRWADILIVCPLTANTLSKISLGLCDNLLTNVIRAWNTSYPILLAPAMVSYSYNAITTKRQLRLIGEEMPWIEVLKPVEKVVGSYGDIGMGGMMDWNEIVNKIVIKLGGYPDDEAEDEKNNEEAIEDDEDDNEDDDDDEDDDDEDDDDDDDEDGDEGEDDVVEEERAEEDNELSKSQNIDEILDDKRMQELSFEVSSKLENLKLES